MSEEEKRESVEYKSKKIETSKLKKILDQNPDDKKWAEKLMNVDDSTGPAPEWHSYSDQSVVITEIRFEIKSEEHDDIVLDLSSPEKIKKLEREPINFKEGIDFVANVTFGVKGDEPISRLSYIQKMSRAGIQVAKADAVLGSFGPKRDLVTMQILSGEIPSGILGRGKYTISSKFIDDDKNCHLSLTWQMHVSSSWK